MRIDPTNGVLADDASASPPSEDVNAAVIDQADDTTLSESDAIPSDDDAPEAGGSDEVIDESDAPEEAKEWVKRTNKTVQRRLREAAEATKSAQQLREELAVLKAQQQGLAAALRSKDPAKMLSLLQEQFGGGDDAAEVQAARQFRFKPSKPMDNAEAQEALNEQFSDLASQILNAVRSDLTAAQRPIVEELGRSKVLVRDREWEKVEAKYGSGAAKWRKDAEALMDRGMPADKALMAASDGAAYALLLKKQQAARQAGDRVKGAATPTLPPRGRAPVGASPSASAGKRRLSDYFAKSKRM